MDMEVVEHSLAIAFGSVSVIYICIIFPLQLRHYILKSRRKLQRVRRSETVNNQSNTSAATHLNDNSNDGISSEQSNHHLETLHTPVPHVEDEPASKSVNFATIQFNNSNKYIKGHMEAEHREHIIEIQREIERQAIGRNESESYLNAPYNMLPSLTNRSEICEYSQRIIDMQREIEQQAIRRQEELRINLNSPHMPTRLINSSSVRTSIFTINSGSSVGISTSSNNYPYAPETPLDDELPSYDQAVAFDSTTTCIVPSKP